jgi:pimeloyl-ACP methyl ester carboxylesterase
VAQLTPVGAIGSYLRKYPLAPRYRRGTALRLTAADGTRLAAHRLAGPPDAPCTVVLVHGFVNKARTPAVHQFAHTLADTVDVIVPDLRGHGRSDGVCTFGRDEPLDVAAAVAAADPAKPVVTMGVSLGGAAVLLHAAQAPGSVAGVVSVSAPVRWGGLGTPGAERIERWVATTRGRWILRTLLGTRVAATVEPPTATAEAARSIAPAFTIVVADPRDWYFGPEHAEELYARAGDPKALWWYPDGGHGTDLLTTALAARLLSAIETHLRGHAASGPACAAPAADGAAPRPHRRAPWP